MENHDEFQPVDNIRNTLAITGVDVYVPRENPAERHLVDFYKKLKSLANDYTELDPPGALHALATDFKKSLDQKYTQGNTVLSQFVDFIIDRGPIKKAGGIGPWAVMEPDTSDAFMAGLVRIRNDARGSLASTVDSSIMAIKNRDATIRKLQEELAKARNETGNQLVVRDQKEFFQQAIMAAVRAVFSEQQQQLETHSPKRQPQIAPSGPFFARSPQKAQDKKVRSFTGPEAIKFGREQGLFNDELLNFLDALNEKHVKALVEGNQQLMTCVIGALMRALEKDSKLTRHLKSENLDGIKIPDITGIGKANAELAYRLFHAIARDVYSNAKLAENVIELYNRANIGARVQVLNEESVYSAPAQNSLSFNK